jgi:hypothetical protein
MVQYIIITIVLLTAIAYVLWRIILIIRHSNDKCYGCSGCAIHDQLMRQRGQGKRPLCYNKKAKK